MILRIVVLFFFLLFCENILLSQGNLYILEDWIKEPTRCKTKDGVLSFKVKGGIPPYLFFHKNKNGVILDTIKLPITNIDYETLDTVFVEDSGLPSKKEIVEYILGYPLNKGQLKFRGKFECIQEKGKPNEYFFRIDSIVRANYPCTLVTVTLDKDNFEIEGKKNVIKNPSNVSLNYTFPLKKYPINDPKHIYQVRVKDSLGCGSAIYMALWSDFFDTKFSMLDTIKLLKNQPLNAVLIPTIESYLNWYVYKNWYKNGVEFEPDDPQKIPINEFKNTIYQLKARDYYGCKFEAFTYVVVVDSISNIQSTSLAYLPTAFSPNDDGINDYFTAFSGGEVTKILLMQVYDRWGGLLFESQDFEPNVEGYGWNGKQRGADMPQGNYTYHLRLLLKDGSEKIAKGEVLLIR